MESLILFSHRSNVAVLLERTTGTTGPITVTACRFPVVTGQWNTVHMEHVEQQQGLGQRFPSTNHVHRPWTTSYAFSPDSWPEF